MDHILRFHFDSAFVVDALKQNFHQPICVIENVGHGTSNAIYSIRTGEHEWLLVAIKFQGIANMLAGKPNFIKTFYGVSELPKGRLLRGTRP